ncbi:hypothetical protein E5675_19410 [Sphingopyxis sp. PAMC25046]|uniref:hypothetical protein n=1 Tax=Sphingopyxis sp. PAMC25046 TaxID=2565556 RepID=UPI00109D839E|nr:hypothetical protein [Sphingopyxis sp. PAMC25046]QCB56384.1 hypothetical protein E5675_19410 [Sphingopyxis sp. PAMC25046]
MKRVLLFTPLFLSLPACAATQSNDGPSLAKRAVEGRFDVAPPAVVVAPPGPLPADLAGRLDRWEADAAAGQQAFAAERAAAASLVAAAAGAPVAGERWVVAQQAISRLVAARAPLTAALADIDRLYLDRSVDEQIDGLPDIYALRDRLADMVSTQDAVIEALSAGLPNG